MGASRPVRATVYWLARALLAIGAIGAIGSLMAMGITFLAARQHTDTAASVFYWSGYTLCLAAVFLFISRKLGAPND